MNLGIGMGVANVRGVAAPAGPPFTPSSLANLLSWHRADLGITLNGSRVSAWADQSGNGRNVSQATPALQHLWVENSANLNNQAAILCDATSGLLSAPFNQTVKEVFLVATYPGTTFTTFNAAFQAISTPLVRGDSATANWRADFAGTRYRDGVSTNAALSTANAKHFYRQIVTTPAASTGYRVGGDGGGSREWRGEIAEIITLSASISAGELTQLHSYITSRYGIAIAA